jgi:osmotically-inducible protein OsmY
VIALAGLSGCGRDDPPPPPAATTSAPAAAPQPASGAGDEIAATAEKVGAAASAAAAAIEHSVADAAITTSVNGALAKDPTLSALHIDVETQDGHVVLQGQAPSVDSRERATRLARAVDGVRSVVNRLEVKP